MTQKQKFLESEGDRWFERSKKAVHLGVDDPVLNALEKAATKFSNVLEIGSSSGWRLKALKDANPKAHFTGIDPSAKAVAEGQKGVTLIQGTADALPFENSSFDLVIFGFCLYLCDRNDLFRIAAEADRALKNKGTLVVYDFCTPVPYKNHYVHVEGLNSYKMDYSRLFSWNPSYHLVSHTVIPHAGSTSMDPDQCVGVSLFNKNVEAGWPPNPYRKE